MTDDRRWNLYCSYEDDMPLEDLDPIAPSKRIATTTASKPNREEPAPPRSSSGA